LESFVFEKYLLQVGSNGFFKTFQVLFKQLAIHDAVVELAAKLLEPSEHFASHVVVVHVGLDFGEHLVVLDPVLREGSVLVDDQVNYVQTGQHLSQVVKNGVVSDFFEGGVIHRVLRVEKAVHLQQNVFRNSDQLAHGVQKLIEHGQAPRQFDFHVAGSFLQRTLVFVKTSALPEIDERVEKLLFDFVFDVY
jgi:hypothetical protein